MIVPISRKIMISLEFSINKTSMEPARNCYDDRCEEKYQPGCLANVSCITDGFVVSMQAARVKAFPPPHPRRTLPGGAFFIRFCRISGQRSARAYLLEN